MSTETPEVTTARAWYKRKRFVIPAAVLSVALAVACGGGNADDKPIKPGSVAAGSGATKPAPPAQPPAPKYDTPSMNDFRIGVKVTSKHCFGSAGCNLQVKTSLSNVTGVDLDPGVTYELTYELLGDEDGPVIESMEIHGDQYSGGGVKFLSTATSGTRVTARITSLEES